MYPEVPKGPAFRCPICRSGFYSEVTVNRADGKAYKTEFMKCAGCSVMFTDATRFTLFEPYKPPEQSEAHRKREDARLEFFRKGQGDR